MTFKKTITKTLMAVGLLCTLTAALSAQSADAILKEADRIFELDNVYTRSTLSITRSGRAQAPQEMESFESNAADGTARSLTVFHAPARVDGTAYLTVGDELWVRFASTGRVRKLSSSAKKNSAAGSDFSYADMGDGSKTYSDQYEAVLDGAERLDGTDCHRLILTPKTGERDLYEKLVVWITKDDSRYARIEYWEKDAAIKVMDLEDYRPLGSVNYPFRITMRSLARDSESVIETETMEFDSSKVQESFFTTAYLEDIR